MKVIFLDIDGPMAWGTWPDGEVAINDSLKIPYPWLDSACIALRRIIKETGARLVISSDWKKYYSDEELGQILEHYGIPNTIVGRTGDRKAKLSSEGEWDRAVQILDWVKANSSEIEEWIAIDDMSISRYFKEADDIRASKRNHAWLNGDWGPAGKTLKNQAQKIINHLNGEPRPKHSKDS